MNEWLIITTLVLSGAFFAIGGTHIPGIGGQKWVRRYLLPAYLIAVFAYLCPNSWWRGAIYGVLLAVALSSGYGDRTPYWRKGLVFFGYGIPVLILGWTLWAFIVPVACLALFALSNWALTEDDFRWKVVEFLYGTMIGISFVSAVSHCI